MPVNTLANYFHAAATQRRFMQPWLEDQEFIAKGGKIIYAVDTDIVVLFTAPEENSSPSKSRKEGYAQIFPDDDANVSAAIGHALADHIFYRLSGNDCPILVIHPIEEEIQRVFGHVAYNAERENIKVREDVEKVTALVRTIKNVTDTEKLYDMLNKEASTLVKFITGRSGPTAELTRFNRLLADTRIAPPEFALEQNKITDEVISTALEPAKGITEWLKISQISEAWFKYLKVTKAIKVPKINLESDVQMMARLEWINLHMDEKHKLIYITGDRSLLKAAKEYYPVVGGPSFAELYLRHPRAFLGESDVLMAANENKESTVKKEKTFLEFLDVFLSKANVDGEKITFKLDKSDAELKKISEQVLSINSDLLDEFKTDWKDYTSELVFSYGLMDSPEEAESKSVKKLLEDIQGILERLEDKLTEKRRTSWNGCYQAAAAAGFGLLYHKQEKQGHRSRNIPPLLLNSMQMTQQLVHDILASYTHGELGSQEYKDALNKLEEYDDTGYSNSLIYALLFGAEGNWYISSLLASHAMDISEQLGLDNISGREATYLKSFALRHNARDIEDLRAPYDLLDDAVACLERDRESRPGLPEHDIRFDAERLAIFLCYHMFSIFLGKTLSKDAPAIPDLIDLQKEAKKQLGENLASLFMNLSNNENDRWIARNIERTLLTIYFMVALLRRWELEEEVNSDELHPYFERFQENIESEEMPCIVVPYQIKAVYYVSGWWMAKDDETKRIFKDNAKKHLEEYDIDKYSFFPYDKKRFEFLRKVVLGK